MIDLQDEILNEVKTILRRYISEAEVRVYGSRIEGKAQTYSDLDIVIVGNDPIDRHHMDKIK